MSHVAQCSVVIKNLIDLEAAVKRLGGELRLNAKSFRWFGSFVDDSKEWKSMFTPERAEEISRMSSAERKAVVTEEMSKCDHAIRFPRVEYEIGVLKRDDGSFRLRFDSFDYSLTRKVGGANAGLLAQAYALEAGKRAAKLKGWMSREVKQSDGSVKLQVVVP